MNRLDQIKKHLLAKEGEVDPKNSVTITDNRTGNISIIF